MTDPMTVRPGDRVIIVDHDNTVLYSDFDAASPIPEGVKPHLLDFIESTEQDVLRVIGCAYDRSSWVGTITEFRGERLRICASHVEESRMRIVFSAHLLGWESSS